MGTKKTKMSTKMVNPAMPVGPHGRVPLSTARERFIAKLFDRLWEQYCQRVSYVRDYERLIESAGATFVNDHIAFRTLAGRNPLTGIASLSHIFDALGYRTSGCYHFETKHLTARHFQHPHSKFPKLFVSELKTWELSRPSRTRCEKLLATHRQTVSLETLAALSRLDEEDSHQEESLLETVLGLFQSLPWEIPEKRDVLALNEESQYAAWVAVHGYAVNHFTSLVNSHGVDALDDIEKSAAALSGAGVPMKAEIAGLAGSKLRQTATQAVVIDVSVRESDRETTMPWSYAYLELAERGNVVDSSGRSVRFEGFLGPQATQLFEMTQMDEPKN